MAEVFNHEFIERKLEEFHDGFRTEDDMKESDVQKTILDGLAAKRVFAFRLNTGSGWAGGRPVKHHSLGKGAADILAFPGREVLWIEVKNEQGKQKPEQRGFQEFVEEHGQRYIVAKSWEDVEKFLAECGA